MSNIKQTHKMLFQDQKYNKTPPYHEISSSNLPLLAQQQSLKSIHKVENNYREFQHALNMLKLSVEELWHLELEQLQNQESTSVNTSNIDFDLQVPSIYTCRAVLPMVSETIYLENKNMTNADSPINSPTMPVTKIQNNLSNKINTEENILSCNSQKTSTKWKSAQSLISSNKERRQHKSNKNFNKYGTKTGLVHLKFRCLKRVH